MACMCGDYCCGSCGPAQGNWHCPICNEWASEGCEHIDEDTGELKPVHHALAAELGRQEAEGETALVAEIEAAEALVAEMKTLNLNWRNDV